MAITLPSGIVKSTIKDPKNLIIFSKPKIGKSSALAKLPGALCVDLENGGYDYIDAVKVKINSTSELKELCTAIKEAGYPYKFIVLDTLTALEEMAKPLALKIFQATPAGSKFTGKDVLTAPNGAGYGALRTAIEMCVDMVAKCAPNIILVCHTKDAAVGSGDITVRQIDLLGKTGRILASKSDAIGYLDRDDDSNTILSFNTNDKFVECGARPEHLRNKDVILGEMKEDGSIEYHWDRVFPSISE